ncbi:lung seven transmembrane receptor-domain-containing protein [Dichotomocladium elegans]|nr:lung seven transmembrane receptor-domain-containing protein [Dichotomocladium elegans]
MIVDASPQVQYVCDERALAAKLCTLSQYGNFIVPHNTTGTSIYSTALDLKKNETAPAEIALYKVEYTGYYCVAIIPANLENNTSYYFDAFIEWRLPYGNLPATDYPKLLFYGAFSLVYLTVGIFWGFQSYRYWNDILPVQHFLSATIFYLVVEMAVNWGFWEAYNQTGSPSYALLAVVVLLNSGRSSMSFFMLLVVCMGFSVVKPSLGPTMTKCVILACTHFFFGVIYSLGVMLLSPESAGFLVLLAVFPLSMTMSAFYVWTFTSLATTISSLELRKQHVKATMYKRLHRLLVFSLIMVVVIFILNMFAFSGRNEVDWAARSWKWRWVMLDGLLNILYFVVFVVIIILWRPTYNNQRYGLQQISQDEEEAIALENQLRRTEGSGHGDDEYDDDTAIFELGDDDMSDDDGHRYKSTPTSQRTPVAAVGPRTDTLLSRRQTNDENEDRDELSSKHTEYGGIGSFTIL